MKSKIKNFLSKTLTLCPVVIAALLTVAAAIAADDQPTSQPAEKTEPDGRSPMLTMVLIRTSSPGEIKKLRAMPIDIVRIRSDPERQTDKDSFDSAWIVEAVVPKQFLPKLKAKGFDVSEVPQQK
jgi:hypothetical protein